MEENLLYIFSKTRTGLIRYLENRFVEIARASKRYFVLTKNTCRNTVMKESQVAVMEEFVDNVKILINALGYKVLEPLVQNNSSNSTVDDEMLFISSGSVNAKGRVTTEGFVVYEGSTLDSKGSVNSLSNGMKNLRQKLIESDKVQNHVIKETILFSSSSAAASFVLGYSVSGPQRWKTKDGKTLKELEENETKK